MAIIKKHKKSLTHTIAITLCWYGSYPWYFLYFIHSCNFNPTIDFIIITSNKDEIPNKPTNVKIVCMAIDEIQNLASKKFGFNVDIHYPYKLCDLKPAYGFLFSEIIQEYDFWGHGDIDVIYGNIRSFVTHELLEAFDIISPRPDWVPGCFLLFKNTQKMNTLFMQSKDYRKVFTSGQHFCFDETNFSHDLFTEGHHYSEISTEIESMMHVIKRLEEKGVIKVHFDQHIVEGRPGKLKWHEGVLTYRNKFEVLLYHLIKLKDVYRPKTVSKNISDTFHISPTRIY